MPLPTRNKGESKDAFVSRCVSFLTHKGEGTSQEQRVAICMSRATESLSDEEYDALADLVKMVKDLSPPLKKKRKDSDRITKEDGSGTDTG